MGEPKRGERARRPRGYRQRRRWALPTLAALTGLVLTVAIGGLDYRDRRRMLTQQTEAAVKSAAEQASFLLDTLQVSADLMAREVHRSADESTLRSRLDEIRRFLPFLHTLLVVDDEGLIRVELRPEHPAEGLNVSDRGYFRAARTSTSAQLLLGDPVVSRVDGNVALPLSRPVRDPSGRLLGVIVVSVDASFFGFVWKDTQARGGLELIILSPEMGVTALLDPRMEGPEQRARALAAWSRSAGSGGPGASSARPASADEQAEDMALSAALPGHPELSVLGLIPQAELHARALRDALPSLAFGTLLSALLAWGLGVLGRRGEQLASTEKLVSETAAGLPGAIVRLERSAAGAWSVDYVSPGCVELWGRSAAEIRARPELMFGPTSPAPEDTLRASLGAAAASGAVWGHRWQIETPPGVTKWLDGVGRPEPTHGGGTRWVMVILDVTERVQIAEDLARSQEQAHRAGKLESIGQLTGGIAHDFNNLLTVILSSLELLREQLGDDEDARSLVDASLYAAKHGADLTRSMLIFARRGKVSPQPVELGRIARHTRGWAARALPAHTTVELRLEPHLPPISADPSEIESVLLNLMINARDAMPEGGQITIQTRLRHLGEALPALEVGVLEPGPHVSLVVEDTGTGIAPENLGRIFEPFFTTREVGSGTGLGLAMIAGVVQGSGGAIGVASTPGAGTRFELLFPALREAAPSPERDERAPIETTAGARVLLVDDVDAVRALIAQTLTDAGYRVRVAASGDEAAALFEADPSDDVLLTDVIMPGRLDGSALARKLRELRPELPVIFVSGNTADAALDAHALRPGDAQLTKPVGRDVLLDAIERALASAG